MCFSVYAGNQPPGFSSLAPLVQSGFPSSMGFAKIKVKMADVTIPTNALGSN
jgi:hypothetical protein